MRAGKWKLSSLAEIGDEGQRISDETFLSQATGVETKRKISPLFWIVTARCWWLSWSPGYGYIFPGNRSSHERLELSALTGAPLWETLSPLPTSVLAWQFWHMEMSSIQLAGKVARVWSERWMYIKRMQTPGRKGRANPLLYKMSARCCRGKNLCPEASPPEEPVTDVLEISIRK